MLTSKISNSEMPQATIAVARKTLQIINDPEQVQWGLNGHLWHEGKQILVVKGGDTTGICGQVYFRFARETDSDGKPFTLSIKLHGLCHSDPIWHSRARITGELMLAYLNKFFCPCQLVTNSNGQALLLMDEIPKLFGAMIQQPRYLKIFANLFEAID